MSRVPLDDNGEPPLSFHAQPSPDVPSLVPDVDASSYTVSPAPQSRAYVHLTQHDFRPPNAPSSAPSSASSHRKRAADDASRSSSPTKKSRLSESTFAASYRERLQMAYGGCCACETTYYLHTAHIIGKAATDLSKLRRQGLVSLETLGDFDNAIYLCPADHAAFDARDPGLVVVPTHLDFFIEHEKLWQAEIKTMPKVRMPVQPSQYAAHCAGMCAGMPGDARGRYTAYMVVDYRPGQKGRIGPPRTFEWHGDPGAILWKVRHFASVNLEALDPEPAHLQELRVVKEKLRQLIDLQERGDGELKRRSKDYESDRSTGDGPPAGPSNEGARDDAGNDQPPPPPPQFGDPGPTNQDPIDPPFPTTLSVLPDPALYPKTCRTKRKASLSPGSNNSDTLQIPVSNTDRPRKRLKPSQEIDPPPQRPSKDRHIYRWGGPRSSTEEKVRYWNRLFGHIFRGAEEPP